MVKTTSKGFKAAFMAARDKVWQEKSERVRYRMHRSFRKSYRQDYERDLELPGLTHHAISTFKMLGKHWKLFLLLILLAAVFNVLLVGLMNEDTYTQFQESIDQSASELADGQVGALGKAGLLLVSTVTTGGLSQGMSEVQQVFAVIIFLIIWLVTIYLLRHLLAGHHPRLRDGLYNALTPLISTLVVLAVVFLELIPVILVVITYSAAVTTGFLDTPFYALVYFVFAAVMVLLSGYLVSGSLVALIAVSAPGLYPLAALQTASDLMVGRRLKLIVRVIFLALVLAIVWVLVMLPIILLDMWLKATFDWLAGVPIVSLALLVMTCFSAVYATAYLYLFYRRMLDYDDQI